ncbi:MAG: hypothetical protein IJT91_06645 [Clostridia bacterium]|nr:hypothetical protein [Clostridia bacterium]
MDGQYLKSVAVKVLSVVLSLFIVVYLAYHVITSFGEKVRTSWTELVTVNEKISVEAYIMRDETLLYSGFEGNAGYVYTDGDKVSAGSVVANIYPGDGNDGARKRVMEIDRQINVLENSSIAENALSNDSKKIDGETETLFGTMLKNIASNDLDYVVRRRDEFLVLLNRRQLMTNSVSGFSGMIELLQSEKYTLNSPSNNIKETVTAPASGYFYSEVDGYENIFTSRNIDLFNKDDYDRIISAEPETKNPVTVGKIVTDYKWYIVCEVESEKLPFFTEGNKYNVVYPFSSDAEIPMKLYRIINDTDNARLILVFETGEIRSDFNYLRRQTVDIVENSYTGYKVPVSAIRMLNGEKGVYVLNGNVVEFRKINALAEIDGYCICAENTENDKKYLGLYDQIITKGKGVHENMVVG